MADTPCPECKGKCCRSDYGYRVEHMGAECYEHSCEACHDGTKPKPVWTAEQERAAVVAFLREYAVPRKIDPDVLVLLPPGATVVSHFAEAIERGDHCREEEP